MARVIMVLSMALLLVSTVEAQDPATELDTAAEAADSGAAEAVVEPVAVDEASVGEVSIAYEDPPPSNAGDPDCLTKVYCKVVKGKLWIEGTFGPAKFNATKFRTINLLEDVGGNLSPSVVVSGPEFGAAIGAQFKIFSIGARFKYAKFDPFDLLTAGLDFGFLVKKVPFVAPYARFGLYYNTTRGGTVLPVLDQIYEDTKTNGGGASIGAGVRVPVIKWLSIAIGFDYTFVALYVTGFDPVENEDVGNGTIGGEISGTFTLTVHPI
ncbi:MAG: hypothetical protein KJN97_18155 [Deltaproteobacteria bacterium]|nr:hypothetical protein [Deltaproteobacteria bacterium]